MNKNDVLAAIVFIIILVILSVSIRGFDTRQHAFELAMADKGYCRVTKRPDLVSPNYTAWEPCKKLEPVK